MQILSVNCSPLRQSFGTRNKEKISNEELLDDITMAANTIKDSKVSDEKKAKVLTNLNDKVDASSPWKVIIATLTVGGAGFLVGRKMVGKKTLNMLDKNTKVVDALSEKVNKKMEALQKLTPTEDKSVMGVISRNAKSFTEKFEKFAKKGMTPEQLKELENSDKKTLLLSKNAVKNGIQTTGGFIGAIFGGSEVAKDKDKNGKSDFLEKTSELSTFNKITKTIDTVDAAASLLG